MIVVDRFGLVIGRRSMPDAWAGSVSIAESKAFTAVAFSSDENALTTRSIGALSQPGGALWNIGNSNRKHGIIEFPGGVPLYRDGKLIGAIGVSGDGVEQDENVAEAVTSYPHDFYERGVHVAICTFRVSPSDPLAGHKTTSYLPRLLALRDAQQARCVEALWFTTANRLAEGSISNVWIVRDGVLKTPPLDTPVLPGLARGVVLEIAKEIGIETRSCPLTIDDLLDADEVLLSNAIMQVMPVIRVERRDIGTARVGPIAKRLLEEYRRLVRRECGEA